MNLVQYMRKAKELINTSERWTQGAAARDKDAIFCHAADDEAVCFCSIGALRKYSIMSDDSWDTLNGKAYQILEQLANPRSVAEYNDTHTHEEVMQWWDKAISIAKTNEEAGL